MPPFQDHTIVVLPGDGVGPEVAAVACAVLDCVGDFYGHRFIYQEHLIGGVPVAEYRLNPPA